MVRRADVSAPWSVLPGGTRRASWISVRARGFLRWPPPVCCIAPVLATDIEPWSVCVAKQNAELNRLGRLVRVRLANGWRHRAVRAGGPYDLVFANILARPLCLMARQLALNLAPGATVILGGLLWNQVRSVLAAHLRCSLRLEASLREGPWATLILRQSIEAKGRKTLHIPPPRDGNAPLLSVGNIVPAARTIGGEARIEYPRQIGP